MRQYILTISIVIVILMTCYSATDAVPVTQGDLHRQIAYQNQVLSNQIAHNTNQIFHHVNQQANAAFYNAQQQQAHVANMVNNIARQTGR